MKHVRHSGDLDCTYHYYYDGDSLIETHNGSGHLIRHHVWGVMYIDELVQVTNNLEPAFDPQMQSLGSPAWALADANYNVIGVVDEFGVLLERYEYTPYGQRIVYSAFGPTHDPGRHAPMYLSQRVASLATGDAQPWGRNDIGHQGLMHDEETGLVYNRARMLHPALGRFMQRDPLGYVDGMGLYEYARSGPVSRLDPTGLWEVDGHFYTVYMVAVAVGYAPEDAYELAYYAQYPDEDWTFNAISQPPIAWGGAFGAWLDGYSASEYMQPHVDIQELLHSLHGGDPAAVLARQQCLGDLIRSGDLEPWERGLMIHALGDSFSHTRADGSAFKWPFGHAHDRHRDSVARNPENYQPYVATLASALYKGRLGWGEYIDELRPIFNHGRLMREFDMTGNAAYSAARRLAMARYGLGEHTIGIDPDMRRLSAHDVQRVLDKIRNRCCE